MTAKLVVCKQATRGMRPVLKICKRGKERAIANGKSEYKTLDKGRANHARTTHEVNGSLLLLLPMHLIFDILIRLPIYTIFSCKCVCQTFKKILSDPYFAEVRLAKGSCNDYSLVIQDKNAPSSMSLAPVSDLDKPALYSKTSNGCNAKYLSWQTLSTPTLIPKTKPKGMNICFGSVRSCNGLICIDYLVHGIVHYCVCNPILGEFTILPQSTPLSYENFGFGFCPNTKQYKVLRFFQPDKKCFILTLGRDDKWRRISDAPLYPYWGMAIDSSFKGNLHWMTRSLEKIICSFNLETEQYLYISLPSCFKNKQLRRRVRDLLIGTLDGLFCVSCMLHPGQLEVFVMEDYEVKESWIKKISIDIREYFQMSMVRFLDNGVLVLACSTQLIYYDTRKTTSSVVSLDEGGHYIATGHVPSLMSLKDIVGEENVEQVERKMMRYFSSNTGKHLGK